MAYEYAGGLWKKKGEYGDYLSGEFEPEGREGPKFHILVSKVKLPKKNERGPDYHIKVKREERQAPVVHSSTPSQETPFQASDDDIPF